MERESRGMFSGSLTWKRGNLILYQKIQIFLKTFFYIVSRHSGNFQLGPLTEYSSCCLLASRKRLVQREGEGVVVLVLIPSAMWPSHWYISIPPPPPLPLPPARSSYSSTWLCLGHFCKHMHWPNVGSMLVYDVGPTLNQHWVNASCLLGYICPSLPCMPITRTSQPITTSYTALPQHCTSAASTPVQYWGNAAPQ